MEEIKNSQEQNEALDRLRPEWPEQYVLVNAERGSVVWFETHDAAVRNQSLYGGVIINTKTADAGYVKRCLDDARRNM